MATTKSATKKTAKKAAPANHVDLLTIRSGHKDFTGIVLNDRQILRGPSVLYPSQLFMAGFINSQNTKTKKYTAKLLFKNTYTFPVSAGHEKMVQDMKNDLNKSIIAPANKAKRVPIVAICVSNATGLNGGWNPSSEFMDFMHQLGAGPKLSDINQKYTQIGSYYMTNIGYALATKYDGNQYYEAFEAADTKLYPSACLSLQMVQHKVTLANKKTNSFMTLQDNT